MTENILLSVLTVASFVKSKKSSAGYELANRVVSGTPPWRIIDGLPGAELVVKIECILILSSLNQIYCVYFADCSVL